jgi:phosphatidylglycerophosphate synthase
VAHPFFIAVEQIGFGAISSCLIAIFNMALVVRVVRQKYRIHRSVQWKKQRKLPVQMIALSLLFLIFSLPSTTIYLVRLFGPPDWADKVLPIFFVLLLPYVCLDNLPYLWKKLNKCNPRQHRRVAAVELQP